MEKEIKITQTMNMPMRTCILLFCILLILVYFNGLAFTFPGLRWFTFNLHFNT